MKPKKIHNKKTCKKEFLSFSQNRFLSIRKKFHALFFQNGWIDQGENFFMSSSAKLGWAFFLVGIWFPKSLAAFTKLLLAVKRSF
jgi:hypothetical protein